MVHDSCGSFVGKPYRQSFFHRLAKILMNHLRRTLLDRAVFIFNEMKKKKKEKSKMMEKNSIKEDDIKRIKGIDESSFDCFASSKAKIKRIGLLLLLIER